jgi:archaellum component FlaC
MENEDRLTRIENSIELLRIEIVKLQQICSRMDKHITFVEDTYETLKNPIGIIKNKIEGMFSSKTPTITM